MQQTKFDPTVFLSMPDAIGITQAAAIQLDRAAIEEDCLAQTLVMAIWGTRITILQERIQDIVKNWNTLDGGSYSLIFEDGLATIDLITPDGRTAMVCTEAECEAAQMDIEDYFNHSGAKITRFYS